MSRVTHLLDIPARDHHRIVTDLLPPGTPIPSSVRSEIRSFVRQQSDFKAWSCGLFQSRNIPNHLLIRYAREHPRVGIVVLNILTDGGAP
jgi:hypothetical protein